MSLVDEVFGDTPPRAGIQPYKSAGEAYRQDVLPRSSLSSAELIDNIFGDPQPAPAAARSGAAPSQSSSDFARGFSVGNKQLRQTAYGAAALLGDTVGADSVKQWGLRGYQDASREIEQVSKPSDSFTNALSSDGSLVDWFQYSTGYLLSQAAQTLTAAGAGALAGGAMSGPAAPAGAAAGALTGAINKAAVQTGIRGAVSKMIDKEAAKITGELVARNVAVDVAKRQAAEQAVKSVYRGIGATAATTFLNATQSLGSVYGEAVEEAAKNGEDYSLGRVWLAGVVSAAVDTWADSKILKGLSDAFKGRNRVSSIAAEALKGGLREGLTEGVQTTVERWGADKDLASKEAFKEYIDSAAVGVLGGGITGSFKGAVSKLQDDSAGSGQDQDRPTITSLPDSMKGKTRPLAESDTPKMPDQEYASTIKDAGFMAALYERADEAGRRSILDAVRLEGVEADFRQAMAPGGEAVIESGRQKISSTPDFVDSFMQEIDSRLKAGVAGMDVAEFANSNPELLAYLYVNAGTAERRQIVREVAERSNALGAFTQALSSPSALELGEQWAVTQPDVLWTRLEAFAKTQPSPGTAKFDRRGLQTAKSTTDVEDFEAGLAAEGGFTLKERPGKPAPSTPADGPRVTVTDNSSSPLVTPNLRLPTAEQIAADQQANPQAWGPSLNAKAQTEQDDAALPRDIRGVKMTEKNRPLLAAYFADEIAALQKDGSKAKQLAQLEMEALGVGFSQAEVDQMFGRKPAKAEVTEPKVTRNSPPADPDAYWSPTVTLDYGDYTIENDGTSAVYSLKAPAELSPTAKLRQLSVGRDGATLVTENAAGEEVKVRIRGGYIRLEKTGSDAVRDYEFGGSNRIGLDRLLGPDLMSRLDAAKPEDRVEMALEGVAQKLGLDDLDRFYAEYDNLLQGRPIGAAGKAGAKPAQAAQGAVSQQPKATPPATSKGGSRADTKPGAGDGKKKVPDGLSEQSKKELGDSLAHLADVLAEITGARMNIGGQKYTAADLPDALTRVMKALISEGVTQFKAAADRLMARMRSNKDWAPLADKVDQGMLLKAWNAAGGGKSGSVTGVRLTGSSPYLAKDQRKADKANKFIGRGSERSSTAQYARDFGALANSGSYDASDVVFVSAEGARGGRVDPDFAEIQDAVTAGATILTDDASNRNRPYNVGERQVADFLSSNGYAEAEPGVWRPAKKNDAKPAQGIQKAPEGPAATLRSQTRAPKSIKGEDGMSRDMVITNQNPISARQLYMSPEEVAENERAAEERRSGEDGGARGTKVSDGDDLEGATMVASREGGKSNPAASYYRQALRDAKALLSGRLAMVSPESGKKPQPMRLNSFMLDRMGFEVFEVKLLDDSSGDGARRLAAIRDELSRNVAAVKERSKAKPAAAPPAPEGVANNDKPRGQIPLGISTPRVAAEPEGIRALKSAIDAFIRQTTNASFYEDSIRRIQAKISEIETLLKGVGELTADDGTTFRSRRRDEDERPGLWGYQDENAYDRFEGGMVYDKATPKSALLAARRKLTEDLQLAREGSQRGQARLYRIGMDRIENYILKLANDAISKSKANPDQVREAVRPYLDGLNALRQMSEVRTEEAPAVDAALEEANRNLAQSDFLEGARVAMGLLSDFRSKRISQLELEALEMRGLREGDFTLLDLFNAYEAFGVSPQQRLFAAIKHFSARVSLKDYVAQHGGAASAVDAYFLDMENAQDLMGQQEFERRYAQRERDLLKRWQRERSNVLSRRRVTIAMRKSPDPRKAFDGFLFTRITLEEARNPDLIRNITLRQAYKGLFENLEEAWFSDLATALRRRPDLESALFNPEPKFFFQRTLGERIQAIREGQLSLPTAAVSADPVISPQERAAFNQWVNRLRAGVRKQAEVMARVPYFAALRNDPLLDAVTTRDGFPMVASTPRYDEVVTMTTPAESVSPQTLMDEASQAIESFAALQGIKVSDIKRIDGDGRPQAVRGFSRYTFTLKDGRKLIGEQLDLFPGGALSASTEYGVAVPEVMNAALKNDMGAVYKLFERSDPRTRSRTKSQTFYLSAEPDLFLEESAGRPDNSPKQYEQLYIKVMSNEFQAVQAALDANVRLKALRVGSVDPETGEIITQQMYDELAADALNSILMNAQMESPLDQYGNVMTQYGARVQGDDKVVRTVEEAAQRDAQIGAQKIPSEESALDQMNDGVSQDELIAQTQNMGKSWMGKFERQEQGLDEEDLDTEVGEDSSATDDLGADEAPAEAAAKEPVKAGPKIPKSLVPGMEYRFRRGPAWDAFTMAAVQDIAERLTSGWKNATNVIVLPNAQHLPEPLRSRVIEKLAGSGAKGLYHEGSVYLFSQHLLDAADVEFTLFHEAYGHLGMRAVLGEKFDQFLEIAYRTRPEVKEAADALIAGGMPKLEAIDEVLSDMAAANKEVSVVKQWAGRIVSGLREIGLSRVADWFASMTDAEVAYTLASARDAVRNGTLPPINGAPSEIRLKEARPPYEVFAVKDGLTRGYARYNPVTDTWAVFSATGDDIRAGYTTMVTGDFDQVVEAMKHRGKVEYRLRSGLYVDDKIVADLVKVPSLNDREKYPLWDRRRWSQIRRDAQIRFQNEYLAVFEHVDFLERSGRLTPGTDVKTALTLYERRAGYEVERFRKAYVEPIQKLVEQAGKLGVTRRDIDRFLTARHAFERNAVIAAINPEMKDGGSGLTNGQAQAILDQVSASPAARVLDEIGRLTDRMGAEKVAYLSRTGMITKSMAKKLGGYRHYVNLSGESGAKVDMDDPGMLAGGSKFNVKGKERRALGRGAGNEAENVLERTLQAYEAALIRGQKNEVAQKVLALIETNYSPEFAIVNSQPRVRQFNPETGEVEEVIDANYLARKDVMVAKVGGIPVAIEFKESGFGTFADAIHGMVLPKDNTGFLAAMGRINRFLGSLLTTYNPAFVGINFLRDVGTVYFNAASDGRITQKMARDMMRALPKAISAAIHAASDGRLAKGADPNMLRVLRQMQATGGITYFADRKSLEEQVAQVESLLKGGQGPVQQKLQKVLGTLGFLADVSEIAPRLAAYKVVKENGFSDDQAAVFSGEITVNFNMRGSAQWARQLFLFFNPAVQGSYKLWSLAKQNPGKFAAVAGGLFVLGFLTSMFARASAGEDEDGINRLDKVPVYKRATSIVLAPDAPLGAPIPIPYGWNAFFAAGTFVADSLMGAQSWATTGSRILKTTAEAFSPIGMGASDAKSMESFLAKFFSPTAALPAVEIMLNENRFGAPIYKQQSAFDPAALPDAQSYFRGVSPISRAITDTLTEMTGGSKLRAGAVDVSPATIDHLFASFLPGLPSDVYKGAGVAIRASQGEDIKRVPWPVIDRFSARIPSGYDAGAYRRAAELVETLHREYTNTRDQERRREIRAELPRLGYAHATIASTRQQLREIRSQMAALDSRSMSDDQRVARRNQLMKREEEVLRRATKRLMQAGEPVREAIVANE